MEIVAGIFSAVFGFIGLIHLLIGLTQHITGFIISGSICLALFLLCMFIVLRHLLRVKRLKKTGRKVLALITGYTFGEGAFETYENNGRRAKEGVSYLVTLECQADGKEYEYSLSSADPDTLIGKCIPIYFSKDDPDLYRIEPKEIH